MKKPFKRALIAIIIFLVIYEVLGLFGIIKLYNNPTTANEPNLKFKSKMFVSNLITPKVNDFVCYKYNDEILGKHIRVHRLCAVENDIIEIKNGIVFRNGKNLDENLNLIHFYKLSTSEYESIKHDEQLRADLILSKFDENTIKIQLEDNYAQSKGFNAKKIIDTLGHKSETIFNENWNKDNFGPLTIPKGKIFVIGDNRDYSIDSRAVGLIDASNIVGVIWK